MEKLVGKVTYVRIPKLGLKIYQLYLFFCLSLISYQFICDKFSHPKNIPGINISLGASLVTELDDPGKLIGPGFFINDTLNGMNKIVEKAQKPVMVLS